MLLIKDTEVLEGFAGALGIYFTRIIISDYLLHKPFLAADGKVYPQS